MQDIFDLITILATSTSSSKATYKSARSSEKKWSREQGIKCAENSIAEGYTMNCTRLERSPQSAGNWFAQKLIVLHSKFRRRNLACAKKCPESHHTKLEHARICNAPNNASQELPYARNHSKLSSASQGACQRHNIL